MIKENVEQVIKDIEDITGKSYEDSGVTIVAATKMQEEKEIKELIDAGIINIGENKVQEFKKKYDSFKDISELHFIGNLQSNKAKDVLGKVKLIHSLDRKSLLKTMEKRAKKEGINQDVLVQVNVSKEDTKSGVYVEDLKEFLSLIEKCEYIHAKGLMTMAPHYDNPEDTKWVFEKLKEIFDELAAMKYNNVDMLYLSMGMSHDYKVALECGSNMIRVGTAIFGERQY